MDTINRVYDRVCCEMDDILQKQKFDGKDIEYLGELIDIIKDIGMIDESMDNGYSNGYMRGRSYRSMPMYNRGSSYGRDGGYSRTDNKEMMMEHLQKVADMAMDEKDRKAVERLMSQMEQQN